VAGGWSPRSVFDETDADTPADDGFDDVDGGPVMSEGAL